MTPAFAVMLVSAFLLLLVSLTYVLERNPEFWDRVADRVFGEGGPDW